MRRSPRAAAAFAAVVLFVLATLLAPTPARPHHRAVEQAARPAGVVTRRPPRKHPKPKVPRHGTAPKAAPTATQAPGVIVAIVDGGVDQSHPALAANLWTNPGEIPGNGIDDDHDGIVDDVHGASFVGDHTGATPDESGHGTHVSGIVTSIDPRARIMALKAGTGEWIDVGAATAAIEYAIAHGARVINLSWAFLNADGGLGQALRDAAAHDVLVVAAAGNFSFDNDLRPVYPASYDSPTLLSVAATCDNQSLAWFSDWGKRTVSLAAPGCSIRSTLPGGAYGTLSGTSMAAPAVAGTAALLLETHPHASARDVASAILGGAQPVPALASELASGATLDVAGAEAAIGSPDRRTPVRFAQLSPAPSFTTTRDASSYYTNVAFSWTPSGDDDLAGYRVVVDGAVIAAAAPDATSIVVKIPPGAHAWSVVAYDRSGNTTTAGIG